MLNYKIEPLLKFNIRTVGEINKLLSQLDFTAPPISIKTLGNVVTSTSTFVFVAKNKTNEIIGIITLVSFPKLGGHNKTWIEDLVVDEKYRGKGIAKALMEKALEKAKSLGVKSISLTSRPSRTIANTFYKKLGFEIKETNYYTYNI